MLKAGAAACFTTWGAKADSLMFNFVDRIIVNYVTEEQKQKMLSAKSAFDFYANKDESIKWLQEAEEETSESDVDDPIIEYDERVKSSVLKEIYIQPATNNVDEKVKKEDRDGDDIDIDAI